MKKLFCSRNPKIICFLSLVVFISSTQAQNIIHPKIGNSVMSVGEKIRLTLVGKIQNYGDTHPETFDSDIHSPKSINIHPNGEKYYVNSLEGATTVVYDAHTNKKLKVIHHEFEEKDSSLWSPFSGLYPFTHYKEHLNTFYGKPVESTFSHAGRYLWIPYYRRSYDINAQDPSAVAVVDTEKDVIIRLMETGPLPKMIVCSPDGHYIAIAHWGNNTVGLIDISSNDPRLWKHKSCVIVDYELNLNFSLTEPVDRDNNSGYALRGSVFSSHGKYLLVGCMGGGGGIAIIDVEKGQYLGRVLGMKSNVRHLLIKNGCLYLSMNASGYVQKIALAKIIKAISKMKNKLVHVDGWENCKVGAGARTIEVSPGGRYIFAACNLNSSIDVVDTQSMQRIASLPVDSYPVGLDISKDGHYLFTTSQGRRNGGGNAVDIIKVDYLKK